LGAGAFFLQASALLEHLVPGSPHSAFVDEQSTLIGGSPAGASHGDLRQEQVGLIGFKLSSVGLSGVEHSNDWCMGYIRQHSRMVHAGTSNQRHLGFAQGTIRKDWTLLVGGGLYESSTHAMGPTAFFQLTWSTRPSLELN
jgi:hypothetical protein